MDDQELQLRVRRVSERWTDSVWLLANEPSVGLFRVQEHIVRSLPELAEQKTNFLNVEEKSNGVVYDVEYACGALSSIASSSLCFSSVESLLSKAISLKEKLSCAHTLSPAQQHGASPWRPSVSLSSSPLAPVVSHHPAGPAAARPAGAATGNAAGGLCA